jgi:hypothetical protein
MLESSVMWTPPANGKPARPISWNFPPGASLRHQYWKMFALTNESSFVVEVRFQTSTLDNDPNLPEEIRGHALKMGEQQVLRFPVDHVRIRRAEFGDRMKK